MIELERYERVAVISGSLLALLLLLALALANVGGEGRQAPGSEGPQWKDGPPERQARVVNVADYKAKDRTTAEAIQSAIEAAAPGDTVFFPGGTYVIDKPFFFGSKINHVSDPKSPAVLVGKGQTSLLIRHDETRPLHNTTIQGLWFDNIEVRLSGDESYGAFVDVTIRDCAFRNGRRSGAWDSDYLWLRYTSGVTVDDCTFLRNAESGGRGVILERTRMSAIKDSYFGTTRDLEDGKANGYFKTAINLTGYDEAKGHRNEQVVIDGNVLRRADGVSCAVACEDHGLYAWGAKDVSITNNYIDGWTNTATGGSVKLRNSEDVYIADNRFSISGLILTTHWHDVPRRLHRVLVRNNRLDLGGSRDSTMGITYRRSDGAAIPSRYCPEAGGEDDLQIVGNQFVNGGTIYLQCADGREMCVANNPGAGLRLEVPAVRTTGCGKPGEWVRPLTGLHRGDFNGDGKEDFVHRVRNAKGAFHWRAHLSAGDGFVNADWGDNVTVGPDTEKYGLSVGDFNGDKLDDIAYSGACGSSSNGCWRVHESSGTNFRTPRSYGTGGRFSAETARFGLRTGDFNGDGRDDIVFRGACGTDTHPCWTVLAGQSDHRFTAKDWGDGAQWNPAETDTYGLLVGDFDGDDRDDIAYRGVCADAKPCMRVHLSGSGRTFVAEDWGDDFYPDGVSPHFGMRVADVNGDGKADIGYRGRCGSPGVPQWRYHLGSSKRPFTILCAEKPGR